jgi:hypothetical protein
VDDRPAKQCPPERIAMSALSCRPYAIASATSVGVRQRAMAFGLTSA